MSRKENLINNLKNDVLCAIQPSSIEGVGVFAVRDIPEGTELFKICNDSRNKNRDDLVDVTEEEISGLDESVLKIIKSCCAKSHRGTYALPETGLNTLHWGFFLNHSSSPNLSFKSGEENEKLYVKFITNRDIKKGEELTENYSKLGLNSDYLREQYKFLDRENILRV